MKNTKNIWEMIQTISQKTQCLSRVERTVIIISFVLSLPIPMATPLVSGGIFWYMSKVSKRTDKILSEKQK